MDSSKTDTDTYSLTKQSCAVVDVSYAAKHVEPAVPGAHGSRVTSRRQAGRRSVDGETQPREILGGRNGREHGETEHLCHQHHVVRDCPPSVRLLPALAKVPRSALWIAEQPRAKPRTPDTPLFPTTRPSFYRSFYA